MLAIEKADSEVCVVSKLEILGSASLPPGLTAAGVQFMVILTFAYADGTTGTGTSMVEIDVETLFLFFFELSADEANGAGMDICALCDFVLTVGKCVSNCGAYGAIGELHVAAVVSPHKGNRCVHC